MTMALKGTTIPSSVATAVANLDGAARQLRLELRSLRRRPVETAIEAPQVVAKRELLRSATAAAAAATQAPLTVDQMRLVDRRLEQATDKLLSLAGKLERTALQRDAKGADWPRVQSTISSIDGPAAALLAIADATLRPQATSFNGKLLVVHPFENPEQAIARWTSYAPHTSLSQAVDGVAGLHGSFHRRLLTLGATACLQGDKRCDDLYREAVQWCLVKGTRT